MGHDRDQPQQCHGTPTAPLDPPRQRPYARTTLEIDQPRTDAACKQKARRGPGYATQFGPDNSPSGAEEQPGDNGEQGARDEYQASRDMDRQKPQRGRGIAAD